MRQKNNFVFLQIPSQVLTKRSTRRVLTRPHNDDRFLLQHRIDLVFAGWGRVTSAERSNVAIAMWSGDFLLSTVIFLKSAANRACNSGNSAAFRGFATGKQAQI
jgi:hypothetical protein